MRTFAAARRRAEAHGRAPSVCRASIGSALRAGSPSGSAAPGLAMTDQPSKDGDVLDLRVFLACSQDMDAERKGFQDMLGRIGARPNFARRFRTVAVTWDNYGGPADEARDFQDAIFRNAGFDQAQVVVVLCGAGVGPGTLAEYRHALELRESHGAWPALLVFFKADQDGTTLSGDAAARAFRARVIADGACVPTNFRSLAELEDRLTGQLEALLLGAEDLDPALQRSARRAYLAATASVAVVSVAALAASQTMAFPDHGVRYWKVLLILIAPPLLFVLGALATWAIQRSVRCFRTAWASARYTDKLLFEGFSDTLPDAMWPAPARTRRSRSVPGEMLVWLLMLVALVLPPVVQHGCIFGELLEWQFVVSPDVLASDSVLPAESGPGRPVSSRFVEKGPLAFPYGASDPAFDARRASNGVVYVYAPGALGDGSKFGQRDAFRENLGPEVFLPEQPLIYLVLWLVQIGFAGYVLWLLVGLRFRPGGGRNGPRRQSG